MELMSSVETKESIPFCGTTSAFPDLDFIGVDTFRLIIISILYSSLPAKFNGFENDGLPDIKVNY